MEGPHLLAEAVGAGVDVLEVFGLEGDEAGEECARRAGAPWRACTQTVLDRLAPTESPRGPIAVVRIPDPVPPVRDALLIDVSDPGNAGTLIRTAAAFAMDVVIGPDDPIDVWSPKVVRAGAGGHFHTRIDHLTRALPPNMGRIATVVRGGIPSSQLGVVLDPGRRWAVLVGSEPHGLAAEVVETADVSMTITMPGGAESLNAAVAGAIAMYELSRWRMSVGAVQERR